MCMKYVQLLYQREHIFAVFLCFRFPILQSGKVQVCRFRFRLQRRKREAKREKRKVLLMTFSSMPVGVASTEQTAHLACRFGRNKNDKNRRRRNSQVSLFCSPASRFFGKKKNLRLQGLLVFNFDDDDHHLVGGFKYFLFSSLPGEMIQFD